MRAILVTGPIGSGKSEVCRYLASLDFPVYDCDSRTKMLYSLVPGLKCSIEERLGIPWSQIGTVFSDPALRCKQSPGSSGNSQSRGDKTGSRCIGYLRRRTAAQDQNQRKDRRCKCFFQHMNHLSCQNCKISFGLTRRSRLSAGTSCDWIVGRL